MPLYFLYQLFTFFIYLPKKIVVLPILLLLFSVTLFGQNNNVSIGTNKTIDSLLTIIKKDKADTNKVNHFILLTDELRKNGDIDNGLKYVTEGLLLSEKLNFKKGIACLHFNTAGIHLLKADYSKTLEYYQKALTLYEDLNDRNEIAKCLIKIGKIYILQTDFTQALTYTNRALEIAEEIKNNETLADCQMNIGNIYIYQSNYPLALTYYFKALKLSEELKNNDKMAFCIGNIGTIYLYQQDYKKALDYYFRTLKLTQKSNIKALYVNIGHAYSKLGEESSALDYYFKALELVDKTKEKNTVAILYLGIGSILFERKEYPNALNYFFQSLNIAETSSDQNLIAANLLNIGDVYSQTGKFKEAETFLKKAIAITDSIGGIDLLLQSEETLSRLYNTTGQYEKAFIHYKKSVTLKDSIFSQENKKQLVQKEMTYEFDKKSEILKAENEKQQAIAEQKAKTQNIIIWSVTGGLLLVFIFTGLIFRSLYVTRKQKNIIEKQRNEVSKQKEIADSQRIIAEELRSVAEKQKEVVQEKQKEIVDSITYAKRIQTALLTSDGYIKEHLPAEHFILFKPKDIVSGDFYWALNIMQLNEWELEKNSIELSNSAKRKNIFYIITADCTGHGVPGAFMSMLNISYLNENVIERKIRLPHEILNAQRKEIIQALNPKGSMEESKDGMDCVLCAYDFDKMILNFAAANNPLWLIRKGELIEYKADKIPVGKYDEVLKPFTLQTIELQKDDIIYTSTDGFADQFGTNGKKLMKKKFKEELLTIQHLSMNEQKEYLDNFFESWKGNNDQVDDVCVIGVKI